MKQKVFSFFMTLFLVIVIGSSSVHANYNALEKNDTISTHAKGNDNGHPPSVLPPQCL